MIRVKAVKVVTASGGEHPPLFDYFLPNYHLLPFVDYCFYGKISSDKNKDRIKEIISKSPTTFGYLKNTWSIRLLATYLTTTLGMNVSPMQTWRIVHDLGIVSKHRRLYQKEQDKTIHSTNR
jgi:transposase